MRESYDFIEHLISFKMEGVPRMSMLGFDLKICPEHIEFGPALKSVIEVFRLNFNVHARNCFYDFILLVYGQVNCTYGIRNCFNYLRIIVNSSQE